MKEVKEEEKKMMIMTMMMIWCACRARMVNAILNPPVPKSTQFIDYLNLCSVNLTYAS